MRKRTAEVVFETGMRPINRSASGDGRVGTGYMESVSTLGILLKPVRRIIHCNRILSHRCPRWGLNDCTPLSRSPVLLEQRGQFFLLWAADGQGPQLRLGCAGVGASPDCASSGTVGDTDSIPSAALLLHEVHEDVGLEDAPHSPATHERHRRTERKRDRDEPFPVLSLCEFGRTVVLLFAARYT